MRSVPPPPSPPRSSPRARASAAARFALRAIAFDGLRTVTSVVSSVAQRARARSAGVCRRRRRAFSSSSSFSSRPLPPPRARAPTRTFLDSADRSPPPPRASRPAAAFPAPERRHQPHARELVACLAQMSSNDSVVTSAEGSMRSGGTSASGFAAAPLDFFRPMTLERRRARACGAARRRPRSGRGGKTGRR